MAKALSQFDSLAEYHRYTSCDREVFGLTGADFCYDASIYSPYQIRRRISHGHVLG